MVVEFEDGDPDYFCLKCKKKIQNYDDGFWVTVIDEETGEEDEDSEEVYCKNCYINNV